MLDKLMGFVNSFDFDALVDFLFGGGVVELIKQPTSMGVLGLIVLLLLLPKTRELTWSMVKYALAFLWLFCGGVALKNSTISEVGPFILLVALGGSVAGYTIWKNFIRGG